MSRVHCAVLNARTGPRFTHVHSVTAAMARGKRPVTFRTRKLSLSAPMVLPWRRRGRVGRRRTTIPERAPASVLAPSSREVRPRAPVTAPAATAAGVVCRRTLPEAAARPAGGRVSGLVVRARRAVLPVGERAAAVHTEDGRITAVTA